METIDLLLSQLEELSAEALERAAAGDFPEAREVISKRGVAVEALQAVLKEGPVTYAEWNRMAVIHFQGNRIQECLNGKRLDLSRELMQNVREHALLECVNRIVGETASATLNESA